MQGCAKLPNDTPETCINVVVTVTNFLSYLLGSETVVDTPGKFAFLSIPPQKFPLNFYIYKFETIY